MVPIFNPENPANFLWQVDNGETSKLQNPMFYFGKGGSYNISLTVTNADGKSSTTNKQVKVLTPYFKSVTIKGLNEYKGENFQSLKKFEGGDIWIEIYKEEPGVAYTQFADGSWSYPVYYKTPVLKNVPKGITGDLTMNIPDQVSLTGKLSNGGPHYVFGLFVKDNNGTHLLFTSDFIGSSTMPKLYPSIYEWSSGFIGVGADLTIVYE